MYAVEQPEVFYTYEWALAVQKAYKARLPPMAILGYDASEKLFGVVALTADDHCKTASFLCATTGDYCDFITEPGRRDEFVSAVLAELKTRGIKNTAFTNLPVDSATFAAIRKETPKQRFYCYTRTAYVCAQISFDALEVKRDGHRVAPGLKRLRRFEKAMPADLPVHTEHLRSWDAVQPTLPELIQAHVARFLEIGRISNLADYDRQVFLGELARLLSERNWLVVSRMLTGTVPVAWHYGFVFHNKWFWYQPTFDSSVEKHWPGFCLLSQVIHDALENSSLRMLDLGLGAEAYKGKFANTSRETLHVALHSSLVRHWATMLRHRLAEAARSSPGVERLAENVRESFRKLRARLREEGSRKTLGWMMMRVFERIWSSTEVNFFKGGDFPESARGDVHLLPLTLKSLAQAAILYKDDRATCAYLIRAAKRLRSAEAEGFVLTDRAANAVHFAWVGSFDGFYCSELDLALDAPEGTVMIFDCWTPATLRGKGFYEQAISLLASKMQASGREPWIFSATSNVPSVKGIEKAGFQFRYSLVRKCRLGRNTTVPGISLAAEAPVEEAATGV